MADDRKWQPRSAFSACEIMNDAKSADVLAIVPTDYDWERPFDLVTFGNHTTEAELDEFMDAYGDEWRTVSFPWVIAHVDLIHQVTKY